MFYAGRVSMPEEDGGWMTTRLSPAVYAPMFPTLPQSSSMFVKHCDGAPSAHNASFLHGSRVGALSASLQWHIRQTCYIDVPKALGGTFA